MGFKFSLDNVLEWREDQEEAAKLNVSLVENELLKEKNKLQSLVNENIRLKEKSIFTVNVHHMRQEDLYKALLEEQIIQQKLVVERVEADLAEEKEKLLVAHKDRRIMEKLEERELESYKEEIDSAEQKQLDEFGTINFGRTAYF